MNTQLLTIVLYNIVSFYRMYWRHGIHLNVPITRGGGADLRATAQPLGVYTELTGQERERQQYQACIDHALFFKNRERRIRDGMKERDRDGLLIIWNDGTERYCSICSESISVFKPEPAIARHRHEDSADWRAGILNDSHLYPCHTCHRSPHTFDIAGLNTPWTGGRIPIMATSSTLYQWQGPRHRTGYTGDPFHIERVSVAGARVRDLGHALSVGYFGLGIPVDILIICGLNDVDQGRSAHEIMCDFAMLQEAVEMNLPTSTITIATLPLPPKLCRFPGDNTFRPHDFVNKLNILVDLNMAILRFNARNSRRLQSPTDLAPTYHTRGLKTRYGAGRRQIGPRNLLETVTAHKFSSWRERIPFRMLHLNEMTMLSMGKAGVQFFKAFYGLIPRIPRALGGRRGGQGRRHDDFLSAIVIDDTNEEEHAAENEEMEDAAERVAAVGQAVDNMQI